MADAITGNTELGATKQDLIASAVQRELAFRAKLVPTIMDMSQFADPGSKSVEFPKLSSFSVSNRTEGAAGDATALTATTDSLSLNINAYVAWIIDSTSNLQSRIDAQVEFARRASQAHARDVDSKIITELETVGSLSVNGATPADITKADVLAMREHVLSNEALAEDLIYIVSVDQESVLLNIDDFTKSDQFGAPVIQTGQIGTLFGIPVIRHNGLKAQQAILYERGAMAIAFQKAPTFDEQKANEYGAGSVRQVLDQLYGVKGMQLGEQGAAASESPLVAKLTD